MLCVSCKKTVIPESRFCTHCGYQYSKSEKVHVPLREARVPYASWLLDDLPETDFFVEKGSTIFLNRGLPFDPTRIPNEGDLVPADCVWAVFSYPGSIWQPSLLDRSTETRFQLMGEHKGRPFREFESFLGKPLVHLAESGISTAVWGDTTLLHIWQVTLMFDSYGVCMGMSNLTDTRGK